MDHTASGRMHPFKRIAIKLDIIEIRMIPFAKNAWHYARNVKLQTNAKSVNQDYY
jgi:hypothetical protein